jgi:hypothetical protein
MADYIRPTPRNPILGLLSDALTGGVEWMRSPQRAQQMQGLGGLLAETGIPATVERMSYGEPLTKGRGMTTRLRPEAEAALMTLAPEAVPIGRAAMAGIRATKGLPVGAATVYHGSPYRFQRFDPTKIGSGEGAQAYGYGHYVAESPGVAEDYRRALAGNKLTFANDAARKSATKLMPFGFEDPTAVIKSAVGLNNDVASAIKTLRGSYDKDPDLKAHANYLADLLESGAVRSERAGHVYTIDLPDPAIARMLDWDKPFSQQSPDVRQALQNAGVVGKDDWLISGMKGREIYNRASFGAPVKLPLRQQDDQIYASQRLREAGIPGIRYLDQGSRGAGQGTSNFVVFPGEEDLLRILSVNGGLLAP